MIEFLGHVPFTGVTQKRDDRLDLEIPLVIRKSPIYTAPSSVSQDQYRAVEDNKAALSCSSAFGCAAFSAVR
jgi:hypothetical protein